MNPLMKIMQRLNVWTSELKNWHLRGICKGIVGNKSKELRSRQRGNTVEGIACWEDNVFSVQYHPESAPGPQDSSYLFGQFINMMEGAEHGEAM